MAPSYLLSNEETVIKSNRTPFNMKVILLAGFNGATHLLLITVACSAARDANMDCCTTSGGAVFHLHDESRSDPVHQSRTKSWGQETVTNSHSYRSTEARYQESSSKSSACCEAFSESDS